MAGSKTLKNRIKSTKNIKQMTRAMEAVSAVKMRRSQGLALAARPYALAALEILKGVRSGVENDFVSLSPYFESRPIKSTLLVVITSDKGLAGSFNASVIRRTERIISEKNNSVSIVAIGKKGRDYFNRRKIDMKGEFIGTGDFGIIEETSEISKLLANIFSEKSTDEVIIIYTNFISALRQEVTVRKLLPLSFNSLKEIIDGIIPLTGRYANIPKALGSQTKSEFKFEPSPARILETVIPELIAVEVFHAILEANASEHSSRMIAMKNASESAGELIDELIIDFNKARQAAITKELAEITAGSEAQSA